MKQQLILVPSTKMDNNGNRNEDELIRIGGKARKNLGLEHQTEVELWPTNNTSSRINRSKLLKIYQAYTAEMKELVARGMSREERFRVGFVTTRTFEYICGDGADGTRDIWISKSIDDTVIGTDPEFVLVCPGDGKVKYAGQIGGWHDAKFNADGPLAELRPDPTMTAEDLVNSLQDLLTRHPSRCVIKDYDWLASCCYMAKADYDPFHNRGAWPVGGHIHIGTPKKMQKKLEGDTYRGIYYVVFQRVLDELLTIPLMKLDKKDESIKRRSSYGEFGDYRTEHGRLEHRTLSGMWMAHPRLALITLGTAKCIIDSFYSMLESEGFDEDYLRGSLGSPNDPSNLFNRCADWTKSPIIKDMGCHIKSSTEMRSIINKYDISFSKGRVNRIRKTLRALPAYRKYSEYIDALVELISMPAQKIREINCNLKETWAGNEDFLV